MRVAFYTSGKSSRLIAFYKWIRYSDYPFEFCYYDGNDERIIELLKCCSPNAKIYEPDFHYLHVKSSIFSQKLSDEILVKLEEHSVDYLFCFGDKLLKGDLLKKYKGRIINFHPSLLPAFPGLNAIDNALDNNVKFLGNTAHIVDAGIDTGQIILQSILKISDFHNYSDLLNQQLIMLRFIWDCLDREEIKFIGRDGFILNPKFDPTYSVQFLSF